MMMTIVTMCVPGAFDKEATRAWPKKIEKRGGATKGPSWVVPVVTRPTFESVACKLDAQGSPA